MTCYSNEIIKHHEGISTLINSCAIYHSREYKVTSFYTYMHWNVIMFVYESCVPWTFLWRINGQGRRKRGAGGARAPPLFGIEKKKKGEGGERRGKRVFIQSPTEMYTCIKKISQSNCSKMYKTPELPGAPPPGPHSFWARLRKRSFTIDIPII